MKLCASRAFWLVAYPSQGHEMLFDAHTRSFAALGGVPRRGIYDNMKTAVDKVKKGNPSSTLTTRKSLICLDRGSKAQTTKRAVRVRQAWVSAVGGR